MASEDPIKSSLYHIPKINIVANDILAAHEGMNNFYNEPKPVSILYNMGSVIPTPAFPIGFQRFPTEPQWI